MEIHGAVVLELVCARPDTAAAAATASRLRDCRGTFADSQPLVEVAAASACGAGFSVGDTVQLAADGADAAVGLVTSVRQGKRASLTVDFGSGRQRVSPGELRLAYPGAEEVQITVPRDIDARHAAARRPSQLRLTAPDGRKCLVQPPLGSSAGQRLPVCVPSRRGQRRVQYARPPPERPGGPFLCRLEDGRLVMVQPPVQGAGQLRSLVIVPPAATGKSPPRGPPPADSAGARAEAERLRSQLSLLSDPRLRGTGVDAAIEGVRQRLAEVEAHLSACGARGPTATVGEYGGAVLCDAPASIRRAGQLFAVLLSDGRVAVAAAPEVPADPGVVFRVTLPESPPPGAPAAAADSGPPREPPAARTERADPARAAPVVPPPPKQPPPRPPAPGARAPQQQPQQEPPPPKKHSPPSQRPAAAPSAPHAPGRRASRETHIDAAGAPPPAPPPAAPQQGGALTLVMRVHKEEADSAGRGEALRRIAAAGGAAAPPAAPPPAAGAATQPPPPAARRGSAEGGACTRSSRRRPDADTDEQPPSAAARPAPHPPPAATAAGAPPRWGRPPATRPEGAVHSGSPLAVAYNRALQAMALLQSPCTSEEMDELVSRCCHALTMISDVELSSLRLLQAVPIAVSVALSAVLAVLGYDETWREGKHKLKPDLLRSMLMFSQKFRGVPEPDLVAIKRRQVGELVNDRSATQEELAGVNVPMAAMMLWVRATYMRAEQRAACMVHRGDHAPPPLPEPPQPAPPSPSAGDRPHFAPPPHEGLGKEAWVRPGRADGAGGDRGARTAAAKVPESPYEQLALLEGTWRTSRQRFCVRVSRQTPGVGGVVAQFQQTTGSYGRPFPVEISAGTLLLLDCRVMSWPSPDAVRWSDGDHWQRVLQPEEVQRLPEDFGLLPQQQQQQQQQNGRAPPRAFPPGRPQPRRAWEEDPDPAAARAPEQPGAATDAGAAPHGSIDTRTAAAGSGAVVARAAQAGSVVTKGPHPPRKHAAICPWHAVFPDGMPVCGAPSEEQLQSLWAALDSSGKGYLTVGEMQAFIDSLDHMGLPVDARHPSAVSVERILAQFQAPRRRGRKVESIGFAEFAVIVLHLAAR